MDTDKSMILNPCPYPSAAVYFFSQLLQLAAGFSPLHRTNKIHVSF